MHDQSNSWSIQLINSFSSNWFTLLLLCTSAPLVLYCDRFDRGSRQVKREPVDMVTENYDVSLCQRVGIHSYYTKDHIITCDRCTSGKFFSLNLLVTGYFWWGRMKTSHPIWNYWYLYSMFCGDILSCAYPGIYEIDYFTSFFGMSCISKKKKNAQRYDT